MTCANCDKVGKIKIDGETALCFLCFNEWVVLNRGNGNS